MSSPATPGPGAPRTLEDPLEEARRLIDLAGSRGLLVRLMGGLAFHAQAPTWTARIRREGRDIDLATRGRDGRALRDLLVADGYEADKQYNALYGHKQLYFFDPVWRRPVDVLIDRLEMCHRFDFGDRLAAAHPTLPLAELLLTKLQVVKLNRKDVLDALILLAQHPLAADDGEAASGAKGAAVNVTRIAALAASDWGWWRTITGNLDAFEAFVAHDLAPGDLEVGGPLAFDPATQIEALRSALAAAPKSTRWKLRAKVGDRVLWYEEPEEVGHSR